MKIIKWNCGSYGVRIGSWFNGYRFVDKKLHGWYFDYSSCKFKSHKDALDVYLRYKEFELKIKNDKIYTVLK